MTLPGDLTKKQQTDEIIRVDHAGEYGAKRIYAGQMAVLKGKPCFDEIKHMAEQEEVHLAYFAQEIQKRKVRPTALMPLWHIGAYAMGAITAKMGEKSAMACTVAVEEVIDKHYRDQLSSLSDNEKELKEKIEKFRQEELEHRDTGLHNHAEEAPAYKLLSLTIKGVTKVAIKLSKKL